MVRKVNNYGDSSYFNEQGKLHREDGPAVEWLDGTKKWYINGFLHRVDGPALEWADGEKLYFLMYKEYSYEDWLAIKNFPLLW